MKKYIFSFILFLFSSALYSQKPIEIEIDSLISQNKFSDVITQYGQVDSTYSYSMLYNVGFAYFMLADDDNSLKLMQMALEIDKTKPAPYYIVGSVYNFTDKHQEAIPFFEKAIALELDSIKLAQIYRNLAFAYNSLDQTDLSVKAYSKVIDYYPQDATSYIAISQICYDLRDTDRALEYLYQGKANSQKSDDKYKTILFNIGLIEEQKGNYENAKIAYRDLLDIYPEDYECYAKLIQLHNQTKEYDSIPALKKVLYDAHRENRIKEKNLMDMFCIDLFKVNKKVVLVFERYESGDKFAIYNKILFYILDEDGKIKRSIQTEYSPALINNSEGKYFLCAYVDNLHLNYGIIYSDDTPYHRIKKDVIKILRKEE